MLLAHLLFSVVKRRVRAHPTPLPASKRGNLAPGRVRDPRTVGRSTDSGRTVTTAPRPASVGLSVRAPRYRKFVDPMGAASISRRGLSPKTLTQESPEGSPDPTLPSCPGLAAS
jgi:hypothetical protein